MSGIASPDHAKSATTFRPLTSIPVVGVRVVIQESVVRCGSKNEGRLVILNEFC
jgi:hypothetical protein